MLHKSSPLAATNCCIENEIAHTLIYINGHWGPQIPATLSQSGVHEGVINCGQTLAYQLDGSKF